LNPLLASINNLKLKKLYFAAFEKVDSFTPFILPSFSY